MKSLNIKSNSIWFLIGGTPVKETMRFLIDQF